MLFSKTNMAGSRTQMCSYCRRASTIRKKENVLPHPKDVQLHSSSLLVNQRMDWLWTGWVWGTTHPRSVPSSLTFSFSHFSLFQTVHWRRCEHQQNSSAPTEEGPWLSQVACRSVSFPSTVFLSCSVTRSLPVYVLVSLSFEFKVQLLSFWHCKQRLWSYLTALCAFSLQCYAMLMQCISWIHVTYFSTWCLCGYCKRVFCLVWACLLYFKQPDIWLLTHVFAFTEGDLNELLIRMYFVSIRFFICFGL